METYQEKQWIQQLKHCLGFSYKLFQEILYIYSQKRVIIQRETLKSKGVNWLCDNIDTFMFPFRV